MYIFKLLLLYLTPIFANQKCFVKLSGRFVDHMTELPCKNIVSRPRKEILSKICICINGRWKPVGGIDIPKIPLDVVTPSGDVKPAFFGNIIGHAQLLCNVVEAIDCWQTNPNIPKIPGLLNKQLINIVNNTNFIKSSNENMVIVNAPNNDDFLVHQKGLLDIIKTVCRLIDDSSEILPEILPGLIDDENQPHQGFKWVLPNIIEKLKKGVEGIIDLIDIIGFFDIFQYISKAENPSRLELHSLDR
tara:strand:+ start:412 stop:1149 length:738 start_codon:yes stop_codon:yes gene_type:complete